MQDVFTELIDIAVVSVIVNNNSINLLEHEMRKALCNFSMWLSSAECRFNDVTAGN